MAIILTAQTPPLPTPQDHTQPGISVDTTLPTGAGSADDVTFTTYAAVKWYVTAFTTDAVRFFEVSAAAHASRNPSYTMFGDVGDRLDISAEVVQTPGKITLNIINNEAVDVNLTVVRSIAVVT